MAAISQADYAAQDATGLAELVRRGEVTAGELLDTAVERLEAVNGILNAVTALHLDRARAMVADAGARGPFGGVPFLVKDLFTDVAGTVSDNGSAFHSPDPSSTSSAVVERYEAGGLVIFGRTHSPEFGGTSTSESRRFGITRNPFDLSRTAGGSSGGAAAAVAAGIIPAAQATDAGGSIIIPSSCCGLFGLKPSRGRVPYGPARLEGGAGLAAQHVITRTVRDSAAFLDLETSGEMVASLRPPSPRESFLACLDLPLPRLRIAFARRSVAGMEPAPDCLAAVEKVAALCQSMGHQVEEIDLPVKAEDYADAERAIRLASVTATIQALARTIGRLPTEADLEPATWLRYQAGLSVKGTEVLDARERILAMGFAIQRFMQRYDVILSPAMADLPPLPGTVTLDRTDDASAALNRRYTTYTSFYNWTGQPSMTLPLHMSADGLPVGVLFAGRYGEEDLLLRLAAEFETAHPWTGLAPEESFMGKVVETSGRNDG
ncbi:amidase [Neorhizobium alkalisoli]|uniref:Amidase n=1 Tax=Neorhizobium alkalisoli TaxID=528178 RepID=A0A561QG69_9HYPH|nr:amidase family protein [Neorhizobium alkalisoli]TWF49362.1 amidase [Neorhizobium alkalisoli]